MVPGLPVPANIHLDKFWMEGVDMDPVCCDKCNYYRPVEQHLYQAVDPEITPLPGPGYRGKSAHDSKSLQWRR